LIQALGSSSSAPRPFLVHAQNGGENREGVVNTLQTIANNDAMTLGIEQNYQKNFPESADSAFWRSAA
jgi:hypothetical protein